MKLELGKCVLCGELIRYNRMNGAAMCQECREPLFHVEATIRANECRPPWHREKERS